MCNNRPHRIHLAPSHNSHPRGNGQRKLGPTPCLVANSPESEREWWTQRSISTVAVVVAGAGLFSGIVHPDREGGEGDQERQGRPFMRLHKSSQEPPRARPWFH